MKKEILIVMVLMVLTARGQICTLDSNNISTNSVEAYIGCYDQAIKDYEKDPNNATAWNNKGYALYQQAEADALIYSGNYLPEGIDQGKHMLWREKKRAEALESFDKAIQLNSSLAAAWFNKGVMLYRARSDDSGKDYYGKIIACFKKAHDLSGTPYKELLWPPLNSTAYWIPDPYAEDDTLNNYALMDIKPHDVQRVM